jgi:hypothetical protein
MKNNKHLKEIYLKNSLSEPLEERLGCLFRVNDKVSIGYLFNDDIAKKPGMFCSEEKQIDKKHWKYFRSFADNNIYEII